MPALLKVCSILGLVTTALSATDVCYRAISRLAQYDKQFGEAPANPRNSRLNQKQIYSKADSTMSDFFDDMRLQRSQGTGFSCGFTADWVAEVFHGMSKQYVQKRIGDFGNETAPNLKAGYYPMAGQDVFDYFTSYATFNDRVVFKIVHSPPIDHVIIVEQLAGQSGYRVYQSYNSAYGLAAWLAPRDADLSAMYDNGDIMSNPKWGPLFNSTIQALFGPTFNTANLQYVPDEASPMVPVLKAYVSYYLNANTKASVLANLRKAKERFGEGAIISKVDFFGSYLPKLAAMSTFFKANWGTSTTIPQTIADNWLDLYGTANLFIFPGAPLNLVPSLIGSPATQYYLQASATVVPDDDQCILNRNLLAWSLLMPQRRDANNLADILGEPQSASSQWSQPIVGAIVAAAALSMGIVVVAARKYTRRHSSKPMDIDLEMPNLDVLGSFPSVCPTVVPVVVLETL